MERLDRLPLPPQRLTAEGAVRRVGVELEFIGLELAEIADGVVQVFGGRERKISPYEQAVDDTRFGDFHIELDFHYLKQKGRSNAPDSLLSELSEEMLRVLSEGLVPFEVVGPPIPMDRLGEFEQ